MSLHDINLSDVLKLADMLGVRRPEIIVIGIEPKPAGLSFARGRVPLTRRSGADRARFVLVDWRIEAGRLVLRAEAPPGIPCRVRLPGGEEAEFPEGGKIATDGLA